MSNTKKNGVTLDRRFVKNTLLKQQTNTKELLDTIKQYSCLCL